MSLFRSDALTYFYPETVRPALDRVTLDIAEGESVLVTGPSGGGKTTYARALAGLVPGFFGGRIGGKIFYREKALSDWDAGKFRSEVGMVLQDPEKQMLMSSVERELAFGPENLGHPPARIRRAIMEIASCMGLTASLGARTEELSGGMKQRTALGAVMAMGPRTLILDEPTSQLDPVGAGELLELIGRLHDDLGCTIVLIEQRLERCLPMADRVLFMQEGRMAFDGDPRSFCRWAGVHAPCFVPPVVRLLPAGAEASAGRRVWTPPLTVREGRALLKNRGIHTIPPAHPPVPGGETVARLRGVSFSYSQGRNALSGVTLSAGRGEIIALLGANGAGKSTLLKVMCGLLTPSRGEAYLFGHDPFALSNREKASLCGYCPQTPGDFLFHDTVAEEIAYTFRNLGRYDPAAVEGVLSCWGISHLSGRNPREVSAGERQCVAVAAALAAGAPLLLLDEPTQGQDPAISGRLGEGLLGAARDAGTAILIATQDIEFAARVAHRAVMLSAGEIIADGPLREVFDGAPFYSPQVSRLFHGFVPGVVTMNDAREALGLKNR